MAEPRIPMSVCLGAVRAEVGWCLSAAKRLDDAGYGGIWLWDHYMGWGDPSVPVVECWTTLSAIARETRTGTVGPFVANVMNHHPAVVARMAGNLQAISGGRFVLGIGIGGHYKEHEALGIPFPDTPERVARLEEATAVIRALWTGGPVTRPSPFYPLRDAYAVPPPDPVPRIVVGGRSPGGARLAARTGDGWTAFDDELERLLPVYLEALEAAGKRREDQLVLLGVEAATIEKTSERLRPWVDDPRGQWDRWRAAGADEVVLTARSEPDVAALLDAAERW
jgi:alkanesulfonate monooxygenase SsuD/methylene tetrahydromethanopterin reductase-like flavin-dependent oxidoreductase (luciferase family)